MIPNIGDLMIDWVQDYVRSQINAQSSQQAQLMAGTLQFFPQVVETDLEIPEGKQIVVDFVTVSSGKTLKVSGHLRVLSYIEAFGTITVTSTGSVVNV
jgi:hypothetical protein